jgi:hypothetical protein
LCAVVDVGWTQDVGRNMSTNAHNSTRLPSKQTNKQTNKQKKKKSAVKTKTGGFYGFRCAELKNCILFCRITSG